MMHYQIYLFVILFYPMSFLSSFKWLVQGETALRGSPANDLTTQVEPFSTYQNNEVDGIHITPQDIGHRSLESIVTCSNTEAALTSAINGASTNAVNPTEINVCVNYLGLTGQVSIKNKNVLLRCSLPNVTEKCVIDAQTISRHFLIEFSTSSFQGFLFINGIANGTSTSGGAINGVNSTITTIQCDFKANVASFGGAIRTYGSNLFLVGSDNPLDPTIFEDNVGSSMGGAIFARGQSKITTASGYFLFRLNVGVSRDMLCFSFMI
jgi:hypothetical protein